MEVSAVGSCFSDADTWYSNLLNSFSLWKILELRLEIFLGHSKEKKKKLLSVL